jgi:hypothetical protein
MEEIIMIIERDSLLEINKALSNGWRVKIISPFCQPNQRHIDESNYGAYVVLERKV